MQPNTPENHTASSPCFLGPLWVSLPALCFLLCVPRRPRPLPHGHTTSPRTAKPPLRSLALCTHSPARREMEPLPAGSPRRRDVPLSLLSPSSGSAFPATADGEPDVAVSEHPCVRTPVACPTLLGRVSTVSLFFLSPLLAEAPVP